MRPNSIFWRTISLHVAAVAVTCAALPAMAFLLLNSTAERYENQILHKHADAIVRYLRSTPNGWTLDLPEDLRVLYGRGLGGFAFAVLDESGNVLFSSLGPGTPILSPAQSQSRLDVSRQPRRGSVYYGTAVPEHVDGRVVSVQVAQDLDHPDVILDDVVADFWSRFGWFAIPLLLGLLGVEIAILRRAFLPILTASRQAEAIAPASLHQRLPTKRLPRKILPLVMAVNHALDRLERGFRLQRDFTADAAHELRTPLALLQTHIDTLVDGNVAAVLRADIERMSRILGQLLEIAELENLAVDPAETTDLRRVCLDAVAAVAPLALAQDKEVALTGEERPVVVRASAEAVTRAVLNLVENAIRHTKPGTTVEVELGGNGAIAVLDRGPGVPEHERELVFQRFWRRDRGRAGGAGLGLAIVDRIAVTYAGSIKVDMRPGGGAIFVLSLPPASTAA